MKKIIFLVMAVLFCTLFAENTFEIVPTPTGHLYSVATPTIAVRGSFTVAEGNAYAAYRLQVVRGGSNEIIEQPKLVIYHMTPPPILYTQPYGDYFYTEEVDIRSQNISGFILEGLVKADADDPGTWEVIMNFPQQVTYSSSATITKWGRIAAAAPAMDGASVRGACFYAGPYNGNYENISTRPPLEKWQWKTPAELQSIMDEIAAAGVNVLKVSWWGDSHEYNYCEDSANGCDPSLNNEDRIFHVGTSGDYLTDESGQPVPFNYWMAPAVTLHRSMNITLQVTPVDQTARREYSFERGFYFERCELPEICGDCYSQVDTCDVTVTNSLDLMLRNQESCLSNQLRHICPYQGERDPLQQQTWLYPPDESDMWNSAPNLNEACLNLFKTTAGLQFLPPTPTTCTTAYSSCGTNAICIPNPQNPTSNVCYEYPEPCVIDDDCPEEKYCDQRFRLCQNKIWSGSYFPQGVWGVPCYQWGTMEYQCAPEEYCDYSINACQQKCRRWEYSTPAPGVPEIEDQQFETAYDTLDTYEQTFIEAASRNIFIVPTIVDEEFKFDKEFPVYYKNLAKKLAKLVLRYKHNDNWLKLYDQNGEARLAVNLLDVVHRGWEETTYFPATHTQFYRVLNPDPQNSDNDLLAIFPWFPDDCFDGSRSITNLNTHCISSTHLLQPDAFLPGQMKAINAYAYVRAFDLMADEVETLTGGIKIGFMLDTSPMPPALTHDPLFNSTYLQWYRPFDPMGGPIPSMFEYVPFMDYYDGPIVDEGSGATFYLSYYDYLRDLVLRIGYGSNGILHYIPNPYFLQNSASFLATNPFNITTDYVERLRAGSGWTGLPTNGNYEVGSPRPVYNQEGSYVSAYGKPVPMLYDVALLKNAYYYLDYWKNTGLPLIATAIAGFNDDNTTRPGPMVYGDIDYWLQETEIMMRLYHTAGITLDIWNGFSEGYVWAETKPYVVYRGADPYRYTPGGKKNYIDARTGKENYSLAKALFWKWPYSLSDIDGDYVTDASDPCLPPDGTPMTNEVREKYQSPTMVYWASDELIGGTVFDGAGNSLCEDGTNQNCGARYLPNITGKYAQFVTAPILYPVEAPIFSWVVDHDLDGIPNACDKPNFPFKDGVNGDEKTGNGFSYNVTYSQPSDRAVGAYSPLYALYGANELVSLAPRKVADQANDTNSSVRSCWISNEDFATWGVGGFCTIYKPSNDSNCNPYSTDPNVPYAGQKICDPEFRTFAYSHGSEVMPLRNFDPNNESWKKPRGVSGADNLPTDGTKYQWDWKRQLKEDYLEVYYANIVDANGVEKFPTFGPGSTVNPSLATDLVKYAVSTGARGANANALYLNNGAVNPAFFANQNPFARSFRDTEEGIFLNYYRYAKRQFIYEVSRLADIVIEYMDPYPWEVILGNSCSYCAPTANADLSRFNFWRYAEDKIEVTPYQMPKLDTAVIPIEGIGLLGFGKSDNAGKGTISLSLPTHPADWHKIGEYEAEEDIVISDAVTMGTGSYLIAGRIDRTGDRGFFTRKLYKMDKTDDGLYRMTSLMNLPIGKIQIKLAELNGTLYLFQGGSTITAYAYSVQNGLQIVDSGIVPPARDFFNVSVRDGKFYLFGGYLRQNETVIPKNDLYVFDPREDSSSRWKMIATNLPLDLYRSMLVFESDGYLLVDQIVFEGTSTRALHVTTAGQATVKTIPVEGLPEGGGTFCLGESDYTLFGGISAGNTCTPFTHPWYKQYSIGTTVYSVAGKGNRLYVGTSNSIKVYDISDPNAMVLKYTFSTSNRIVYDLEIADGDIMYAATSKGLYKLNTANPDSLTSILFYSTGSYNYQYRIQLYNGNLYVGDDNGINIRNPESFARVAYVNIGSTMDFAIANGEIAMYWDAFWDSGIDIRDAATLTRKAWDYPYCSNGELTTDHGAFYLSCDGYEYRFVGLANTYLDYFELDGDMREMQENYLYNGWVYIPDGNKVKLSTNNEVPSICGNGIIEPGEFCDGNTEDCAMVDPTQWDSGTAICNSTCTAWDTGDCYQSGC